MRSDAEIIAALRPVIREWSHAENCPAALREDPHNPGERIRRLGDFGDLEVGDPARCTCGLDRVVALLWGAPEPVVQAPDRGYQPGKFRVSHHRRGDLPDGEAFVLLPDTDPAAVFAIVAYASVTPDEDLAAHLRAWAKRLRVRFPALPDLLPSWVATLAGHVASRRLTTEQALFRLAEQIRVASSATFAIRSAPKEDR